MSTAAPKLTGRQKAALIVLSLDVESATKLMKQFTQQEIENLTVEITSMKEVPTAVVDSVNDEFETMVKASEYVVLGGIDYAQKLLEKSLGIQKAAEMLDRVKAMTMVKGFAMLKKADVQQLASFLQKEHPQSIALILSNLNPEQATQVLMALPEETRNDVIHRIATLGKVSPALLAEMEDVLESIAVTEITQSMSSIGGTKAVAGLLNRLNTVPAKQMLEYLSGRDSQLAGEIKRLMFLFEDLLYVDDRSIQRLLREVEKRDLALALKVADEKMREKIFSNMSERARDLLQEELQYLGPVRLKDVEAAQTRIVEIVKQLEDQGEVVLGGRGGGEEVFV